MEDRAPGGTAVHALRPHEIEEILELEREWRAQLDSQLKDTQKRLAAAEKARDVAIATVEQAASSRSSRSRRPRPRDSRSSVWSAIEARVDADLALGRHAELIGELEPLVAAHPTASDLPAT